MLSSRVKELHADELNGENALSHVAEITQYHRSLGSKEYHEACEYVRNYFDREGIEVRELPAPLDNKTQIGNYTVPPAWEPRDAIVKVVHPEERVIVSFQDTPTCINSWSGSTSPEGVTAELVYVGRGDRDEDYRGKDVRGNGVTTGARRTTLAATSTSGGRVEDKQQLLGAVPIGPRSVTPMAPRVSSRVVHHGLCKDGQDPGPFHSPSLSYLAVCSNQCFFQ
jgi:hypothetical protein